MGHSPPMLHGLACEHTAHITLQFNRFDRPPCSQKYSFEYPKLTIDRFMTWEEGDVVQVTISQLIKNKGKMSWHEKKTVRVIPAAYVRLIDQFGLEASLATVNHDHEAQRRATYAIETLNALGKELSGYKHTGAAFRSSVLNPIMQRQVRGVQSDYGPAVRNAIVKGRSPTIYDATEFYLRLDHLDRKSIPLYRRQLIYSPEQRWHLGIVLGHVDPKDRSVLRKIWDNHEELMEELRKEARAGKPQEASGGSGEEIGVPPFNAAEIEVIITEGLDRFFRKELALTVSCASNPTHRC